MNIAESAKSHDVVLQQIKPLRLMDDILIAKCFENNKECTELLLQPILKNLTLQVQKMTAQWHGPSVGLNVIATDKKEWIYQIKVFQDNSADRDRRVGLDLYFTENGTLPAQPDNFQQHYVVYIVEHGLEHKAIAESGIILDGGTRNKWWGFMVNTLYVNGDRKNRSPLGRLMYDFSCTDPSYMNYPQLADRVRYFKEDKQGILALREMLEEKRKRAQNYEAPKDN